LSIFCQIPYFLKSPFSILVLRSSNKKEYGGITVTKKKTPEYITAMQAAEILGVPKAYVYQLINQGLVPAYRLSPRKTVLIRDELDSYIRSQQI
jgi:excisionase family DNA binding protein